MQYLSYNVELNLYITFYRFVLQVNIFYIKTQKYHHFPQYDASVRMPMYKGRQTDRNDDKTDPIEKGCLAEERACDELMNRNSSYSHLFKIKNIVSFFTGANGVYLET